MGKGTGQTKYRHNETREKNWVTGNTLEEKHNDTRNTGLTNHTDLLPYLFIDTHNNNKMRCFEDKCSILKNIYKERIHKE